MNAQAQTQAREIFVYAWRSGLLEFKSKPLEEFGEGDPGPILVAHGPEDALRDVLETTARHGYGRSIGQVLVPGVPEAASDEQAIDALIAWTDWVKQCAERRGLQIHFSRN